jgi:hypothetical protein
MPLLLGVMMPEFCKPVRIPALSLTPKEPHAPPPHTHIQTSPTHTVDDIVGDYVYSYSVSTLQLACVRVRACDPVTNSGPSQCGLVVRKHQVI